MERIPLLIRTLTTEFLHKLKALLVGSRAFQYKEYSTGKFQMQRGTFSLNYKDLSEQKSGAGSLKPPPPLTDA